MRWTVLFVIACLGGCDRLLALGGRADRSGASGERISLGDGRRTEGPGRDGPSTNELSRRADAADGAGGAACELTEENVVSISANCMLGGCTAEKKCTQTAQWNHGVVAEGGSSLELACVECPGQHFVTLSRLSGTWDLSAVTGFRFRMYTTSSATPFLWQSRPGCVLTPSIVLYDENNFDWYITPTKAPPDPNGSWERWLEVSGPLKPDPTQPSWFHHGAAGTLFDWRSVKIIELVTSGGSSPAYQVRFDGFTFTGGNKPFLQCP